MFYYFVFFILFKKSANKSCRLVIIRNIFSIVRNIFLSLCSPASCSPPNVEMRVSITLLNLFISLERKEQPTALGLKEPMGSL